MLIPPKIREEIGAPKVEELSSATVLVIKELDNWGKCTIDEIAKSPAVPLQPTGVANIIYRLSSFGLVTKELDVIDPERGGRRPNVWYLTETGHILADWVAKFEAAVSRI